MPQKVKATKSPKKRDRNVSAESTPMWMTLTQKAIAHLNEINGYGDGPSLLQIAEIQFSEYEIVMPVLSFREAQVIDARRRNSRRRVQKFVACPDTYKIKRGQTYPVWDGATKSAHLVKIVRRSKYKMFGQHYFKYEVV